MEGGPRAALTRCGPGLCYWVCVQWTYVASDRNMDRCLLPKWHSGKESAYQCRRLRRFRFNPWVRKIPWRRAWQPIPVFLPGKSHGQRSLVGSSPWGCKELDKTEWLIHDIPLHREVTCIFLKQSRPRAEALGCGPLSRHGHSYPDPPTLPPPCQRPSRFTWGSSPSRCYPVNLRSSGIPQNPIPGLKGSEPPFISLRITDGIWLACIWFPFLKR